MNLGRVDQIPVCLLEAGYSGIPSTLCGALEQGFDRDHYCLKPLGHDGHIHHCGCSQRWQEDHGGVDLFLDDLFSEHRQ